MINNIGNGMHSKTLRTQSYTRNSVNKSNPAFSVKKNESINFGGKLPKFIKSKGEAKMGSFLAGAFTTFAAGGIAFFDAAMSTTPDTSGAMLLAAVTGLTGIVTMIRNMKA